VPQNADISVIRSAFRRKAKSCHPDLFQHVNEEERKRQQKIFVRLSQAYKTLADPEKRLIVDIQLEKPSIKSQQSHDQKNQTSSSSSLNKSNFKQKSGYYYSSQQTTSMEPEETIEDLLREVEELLGQFGLNFRDPLEMLVEWGLKVYQDMIETFSDETENRNTNKRPGDKSHKNTCTHEGPAEKIEAELQRLKDRLSRTVPRNLPYVGSNIKDNEIEQELRSIKKKYRL
jgi:curved DNA-binding protein CbpA